MKRVTFVGTHAVKGIFRFRTKFAGSRKTEEFYESRILLVDATSETRAASAAKKLFVDSQWSVRNISKEITFQSFRFVGVSRVVELSWIMDEGEVWYEYSDTPPQREGNARMSTPPRPRQRSKR